MGGGGGAHVFAPQVKHRVLAGVIDRSIFLALPTGQVPEGGEFERDQERLAADALNRLGFIMCNFTNGEGFRLEYGFQVCTQYLFFS